MRDQESLSNRRLGGFPGPRPWIRGRNGPVVDLSLACRSRPAGIAGASSSRRRSPRPWRHRSLGFIWPICNTGDRHARSGFSDAAFGCHRTLSLCPKSDVVAVVSAILGQGLILGNIQLLEYGGVVWFLFHLFVLIYEEPTLTKSDLWLRVHDLLC